jgi:hypothetical protein
MNDVATKRPVTREMVLHALYEAADRALSATSAETDA